MCMIPYSYMNMAKAQKNMNSVASWVIWKDVEDRWPRCGERRKNE